MDISKIYSKENIAYLEKNLGETILPLSMMENEDLLGLSPMDVIFFYKKGVSLAKLEESFYKAVDSYNVFSSRLIMIGPNQFALQYCTDGIIRNILPPVDAAFDEMNIEDIKNMMVHVKTLPGEPLFAATAVPVKDGIFGGISCSHALGDGIALILFLFAWNCLIEGNDFPLPSKQRLFKGTPVNFDEVDRAFIPSLSELNETIQNKVKAGTLTPYFKKELFVDEFLNDVKQKAKLANEKFEISNHQIISSILLKKYHHLALPDTNRIVLRTPINLRDVHPDIDALYMGNAYFDSVAEFTKDEINNMSIYEIAYRLKESMTPIRNVNYVKEIAYISKYGLEFKPDVFKNYPLYNANTDIVSSNFTHLNDLETLGLPPHVGSIVYRNSPSQTGFSMLKEKTGQIYALITSRYPLE